MDSTRVLVPAKAEPMTAISGMPRDMPRVAMTGMRISEATVWLTKVAAVRQNSRMITSAIHGWPRGRAARARKQNVKHIMEGLE